MDFENAYIYGLPESCLSDSASGGNGQPYTSVPTKRKRFCTASENSSNSDGQMGKKFSNEYRGPFVSIQPNTGVFQSECWKPNGSTLYQPVSSYLLVNVEKYDQISFGDGSFFIGDSSGGYLQKEQGHTMHCWRFDEREKKLFISLSFLFTNSYIFQEIVSILRSF